ncbi:MAG: protein kinase domain-containing protein [Kofleriaceae bacterium]
MAGGQDDTVANSLPTLSGESPVAEVIAGRYKLVRWLGGGGMGRVYEVLDQELDERVALKVLKSGLTEEAIERFRREVRLTRRIQHKNVARMFDIGEHNGDKFLTMELVEGEPLTRELGDPLPWPRLQRLAVQICEGLAAAHATGVIHRDLKPDNVLVERGTERTVITDFGIARGGDDAGVTQVGAVVGTPRYMAPEQIAGGDVDHRVDIFSLGVILFELATGKRPWTGDSLISIAVAQQTQPPREMNVRGLPAGYVALVRQCLALDRDHRPATAAEIGMAIAGFVATEALARNTPATPGRGTPSMSLPPGATLGATVDESVDTSSIAVLPLLCAPADEYLADGVFEDFLDTLSASRSLRVKPAGIARANAGRDPRELGKELSVDHIIAGSLRRTLTGVRVSARLIGVEDGFQIWAQRLDCAEGEILAASAQLAGHLLEALSTKAAAARTANQFDPRAVDLFLRAKAESRRFWGEHVINARDLLEQALAFAPNAPQIVSAFAFTSVQVWLRTGQAARLEPAQKATERALHTGHGDAYLAAANLELNRYNTTGAGAMLAQALARAPMSAHVHEMAGRLLVEADNVSRGRHHFETALGLDPGRQQVIETDLARLDGLLGNWVAADRTIERLINDSDPPIVQLGSVFQMRLALWRRDHAKVSEAMRRLASRFNTGASSQVLLYLKWRDEGVFDAEGWKTYIATVVAESKTDIPSRQHLIILQRLCELAAVMRRHDELYEVLALAADLGLVDVVWMDNCPLFADLRFEPRFLALRNQVGDRANQFLRAFFVGPR